MPEPPPHGSDIAAALRQAMEEAGYSKRGLAAELQRRQPRSNGDPARGVESWRNTLGRYLSRNEERRQVPDEATAALLGQILNRPSDYFFRPRGGAPLHEENARLRAQVVELRQELERLRARS